MSGWLRAGSPAAGTGDLIDTAARSGGSTHKRREFMAGKKIGLALLLAAAVLGTALPAAATHAAHPASVEAVPSTLTPGILDGHVYAITQVGSTIVVGGSFTQARSAGSTTTLARSRILAFDVATGVLSQSFAPVLSDYVETLLPGPSPGTVIAGGKFNTVNGVNRKGLVTLDLATGQAVSTFAPPYLNGIVQDMDLRDGRLLVAGTFTTYGGQPRGGLASVDPVTGALTGYLTASVTEHHNYDGTGAIGAVGVTRFDITPDGTKMVMIGNFRKVNGQTRRQIAMLDLSPSTATLSTSWSTTRFSSACNRKSSDSWIRDVSLSPDGSYFVVVGKGGYFPGTMCDTASRWETGATGSDLSPTWVAVTGGDTLLSVAITGAAVYVGGHQRWLNNPNARDAAGPGAVPRPGVAALDPASGVPLTWNPGRNPRGAGAGVLYATSAGLWMGSDTEYVGYFQYRRPRLAFFPLTAAAGPDLRAPALPSHVYFGGPTSGTLGAATTYGPDDLARRMYDGVSVQPSTLRGSGGIAWSQVRGAMVLGSTLYYGSSDGMLYRRSFDGVSFGPASAVDPYNDPVWSTAKTGKADGQTYRGFAPSFYGELASVTGLSSANGRLYYTLSGDPNLYWRWWSPESGVIHPVRAVVSGGPVGATQGMFVSGNQLYVVAAADGSLRRWTLQGAALSGGATLVSGPSVDGTDWRARAVFLSP